MTRKRQVTLRVVVPPDKPEDWVNGYVAGYEAGYRAGVEWARDKALEVIRDTRSIK